MQTRSELQDDKSKQFRMLDVRTGDVKLGLSFDAGLSEKQAKKKGAELRKALSKLFRDVGTSQGS